MATTPGAIALAATFKGVSVVNPFTGNSGSTATAVVQFRRSGAATWITSNAAPNNPPYIDTRAVVAGNPNPGYNELRAMILGLAAGLSYEVQVVWTDPDGGVTAQPSTATIATWSYTPPAAGNSFYIDSSATAEGSGSLGDPFKTIPYALANSDPGDVLYVRAGAGYDPFTISVSGLSTAYRVIKAYPGEHPVITAGTTAITINGDYLVVDGFTCADTTGSMIAAAAGTHDFYIQNITGGRVATAASADNYYAAVYLPASYNWAVINVTASCAVPCLVTGPYVDGVFYGTAYNFVIERSVFTGTPTAGFWDGVGNGTNSLNNNAENGYIDGCRFINYRDDCMEFDGAGRNVAMVECFAKTETTYNYSGTFASFAPNLQGPVYVVRNNALLSAPSSYAFKYGSYGSAARVFHNNIDTSNAPGGAHEAVSTGYFGLFLNNIFVTRGNAYYNNSDNAGLLSFRDYNLFHIVNGAPLGDIWNGAPAAYVDLAAWRAGTGQDPHSLEGDPLYTGADDSDIDVYSPAVEAGVLIPNINTPDSAWPFAGTAPTLGPYDTTAPTPPDPPPPVDDCPDSSRTGVYTSITLTQALSDLGRRLYDPDGVFWTDAEKTLYLREAVRTFAAFANVFRRDFTFNSTANRNWYNIVSVTGSLRSFNVTDVDLYTIIEYQLLEPPTGATWTGTNQFGIQDLLRDVQLRRDQLLYETGCTLVRSTQASNGTVVNILCENTIDIRRVAYLPSAVLSNAPLWRDDNWAQQSYNRNSSTPGQPGVYKQSTQPRLAFYTDVPPAQAGNYELLTVNAGATLSTAAPTTLNIPDDWSWAVKYGALAELLNRESAARDPARASYCEMRYNQAVALMRQSPAVLSASIAGYTLDIDAVQYADDYRTSWQAETPGTPDALYVAGLNYIALAPAPNGVIPVTLTVLENSPFPTTGAGYLQIGREDYDAVLDLAQHIAAFKQGGAEFAASMPLYKEFLAHCAKYNDKLAAMGEFTDVLYGQSQLQEQADPRLASPPGKDGGGGGGA